MKKQYTKPTIEKIEFELNESIASCGVILFNHTADTCFNNKDNWSDAANSFADKGITFTEDMTQCADGPLTGYCYFTSSDSGKLLFNS